MMIGMEKKKKKERKKKKKLDDSSQKLCIRGDSHLFRFAHKLKHAINCKVYV